MNTVSMRLPDELLREVDKRAAELDIPRTEYLRWAILAMPRSVLIRADRMIE